MWAVKLGDFTALTLPTEGAYAIGRSRRGASLTARAPSDRSWRDCQLHTIEQLIVGADVSHVRRGRWCGSMARGSISLASHSGRASADGSPRLADGGSCHAYAVNAGPAYAAGGSDLRNHAVWLNNRRWCHRLRRHCNR